jgi:hypothetical protein
VEPSEGFTRDMEHQLNDLQLSPTASMHQSLSSPCGPSQFSLTNGKASSIPASRLAVRVVPVRPEDSEAKLKEIRGSRGRILQQVLRNAIIRKEIEALKKLEAASKVRNDLFEMNKQMKQKKLSKSKAKPKKVATLVRAGTEIRRSTGMHHRGNRAEVLQGVSVAQPKRPWESSSHIVIDSVASCGNAGSSLGRSEPNNAAEFAPSILLGNSRQNQSDSANDFTFNPGSAVFVPKGHDE